MNIDELDVKILNLLQTNAQYTYREIADKVNLSVTPIHDRIKRLEKEGFIQGYTTLLNKRKFGLALTVYCQVTLLKQTKEYSEVFNRAVAELPEILECQFVSGSFDYLLKIITPDMDSFHQFHQEKLSVIEGVSLINSFFVMSEVKSSSRLPIK